MLILLGDRTGWMGFVDAEYLGIRTVVMKTRCLISCENEVMILGLSSLLRAQNDFEWVGIPMGKNVELKALVDQYRPDVLVIDRQNRYYQYLFCLLPIFQYPDLVVIVVELEQNQIQIHRNGQVILSNNANLIPAIRNRGSIHS